MSDIYITLTLMTLCVFLPLALLIAVSTYLYYRIPQLYERFKGYNIFFRVYSKKVHFYWKVLPRDAFEDIWRGSTFNVLIMNIVGSILFILLFVAGMSTKVDPLCFHVAILILGICATVAGMWIQMSTIDSFERKYRELRSAGVIKDVKVKQEPEWWKRRRWL